ncbi:hypothetical protein Efla_007155 [Eimeria flavescens]
MLSLRRFPSTRRDHGSEKEWSTHAQERRQQPQPLTVVFASHDEKMRLPCSYRPGQTLLAVALENDVDIEASCGGRCACSTCHVILEPEDYAKFPEAEEEEVILLEGAPESVQTYAASELPCLLMRIGMPD